MQNENTNWSIFVPVETYTGPAPTPATIAAWEVFEQVEGPLSTQEVMDRVIGRTRHGRPRKASQQTHNQIAGVVRRLYASGCLLGHESATIASGSSSTEMATGV